MFLIIRYEPCNPIVVRLFPNTPIFETNSETNWSLPYSFYFEAVTILSQKLSSLHETGLLFIKIITIIFTKTVSECINATISI